MVWYRSDGRELPWRGTRDPYAILVAEVMLQQTGVERVIPRWHAWLQRFPTLTSLAAAPRAEVIRAWQGLGYNLRAIRLHTIAHEAVASFGGRLPSSLADLRALKGIGPYTAGAVLCFAFEQPVAFVDTNVRRVLGRVFLGVPLLAPALDRQVARLAEEVLPVEQAYQWNQALMDLGATLCTVQAPACLVCPLRDLCHAAGEMGAWPDQRRMQLREARASYEAPRRRHSAQRRVLRGRIVDLVRALPPGGILSLEPLHVALLDLGHDVERVALEELLRQMARDGLLALSEEPMGPAVSLPG